MRNALAVAMVLLVSGGVAFADEAKPAAKPAAKPMMKKTMGTVAAVDVAGGKLSVKDKKGAVTEFTVTADAKIKKGGKPATLADVMVNDSVTVGYEMNGDQKVVKSVMVKAAKAAAPAKK